MAAGMTAATVSNGFPPGQTPLVSIVTPVLNGARYLESTLASIRSQTHPQIEHVIVDGGSTDGTLDLLRAASGIVWTSGPDSGMYEAINRGLREASGEILAYQNADDRYASADAVSAVVEVFRARPEVDVVYGDFRYVGADGGALEDVRAPEFDARRLRRFNFVPPHSTFVRRRIVHGRGLWLDPALRFAGDWEWFLRIAAAGGRFHHLPRVLSEFRRHAASTTSTIGWRAKLAEWRLVCGRHHVSFARLVLHEALVEPARRRLRRR
jgi:glycosyltransferase involved in cell wall biosynthesis